MIKRVEVENYKSFENLDIELGRFNVLIGANASGKSNFVSIFKFLKNIALYGLENAISMEAGGVEYLRNMNISKSRNLSIKVISDQKLKFAQEIGGKLIGMKTYEIIYEFALKFNKKGPGFRVVKDELIQKFEIVGLERKKKIEERNTIGYGELVISRSNGKVRINVNMPKNLPLKIEEIFPSFLREKKLKPRSLLLETFYFLIPFPVREIFDSISVYDFDPKLSKSATPITGKAELEENGKNLSFVLKNILKDKESRRKFFNLVKDLLPFVENLNVEKFADKSLLLKLEETYYKDQYLPASLISDGTINIMALIIALYFDKRPLIIIEEPERNIHPYLISKVIDMMKDASRQKQIIVTTHNPEVVKYAGIENILFVSRDENGFSVISRPADKEEVRTFLRNDIGIEELYIQNLL